MSSPFADLLGSHLQRTHTSVNRLASLCGVPQRTIANWLNGYIRKPHQWQAIVKVAAALHLTGPEASKLLRSAGYPSLPDLYSNTTSPVDRKILSSYYSSNSDPAPAPFQVITDIPIFVGRSIELEELKDALLDKDRPAICGIRGMGGVGKTSLAAHLAYQLREKFPDGVLWAHLGASDSRSILGTFAEAYGRDVSQYKDLASRSSVVRNILAEKRTLIILDNAESSAQVRTLLPPSTGSNAVLITTRYDLSVLDGRKQVALEPFDAASDDAIQLFKHYLGQDFVHSHHTAFREIADLLGYLPLALTIIAGRLAGSIPSPNGHVITTLLNDLHKSYAHLDALTRDDMGVRASFEVSYVGLSSAQQSLFATLGIFSGEDFGSDLVAYLNDITLDMAETELIFLQKLSLVQKNHADRWRLHPLLRDYAREKMEATHRIAHVVEKTLLMYRQAARKEWMFTRSLDSEIPNVRFALDQASQLKLHRSLLETARAIYPTLYNGAWFSLGNIVLQQAREAAQALGDHKADFYLLKELSLIQIGLGDNKNARENLLLALRLARSTLREEDVADVLSALGKMEHDTGHRKQASIYLEESLVLARKLNDPYRVGRSLNNLAFNSLAEARYAEARKMLLEALEISRTRNTGEAIHRILMNLGELSWQLGDWEHAEAFWREALPLAHAGKYRAATVALLVNIAKVYALRNQWVEAEQSSEEAIKLALEINSPRVESIARGELGHILYKQKKYDAALDHLNQGKELAMMAGDMERKGIVLRYLGLLYLDLGQLKEARIALDEALATAKEIGHKIMIADIRFVQAKLSSIRKNHSKARHLADTAMKIYKRFSLSRQSNEIQQWIQSKPEVSHK